MGKKNLEWNKEILCLKLIILIELKYLRTNIHLDLLEKRIFLRNLKEKKH